MPLYRITAPNGQTYQIEGPPGASDADVASAVMAQYPDAGNPAPKQSTIGSELKRGAQQVASSMQTAYGALAGSPEEAAKSGIERGQAISQAAGEGVGFEPVKKAYQEKGLLAAAGEAASQIPRALAGQGANLATMAGGARLGAMAGSAVAPGVGTLVGGALGAGAAMLPQFFGSNVERQAAEQMEKGEPVKIDRTKAGVAAAGQAALEGAGTAFTLGKGVVKGVLGIVDDAAITSAKTAQQLEATARRSLTGTAARGAGRGVVAEMPVEIAQQVIERAQAGLDLTSPDALKEYGEAAYQAGLVGGPLGGAGNVVSRGQAQDKLAAQEKAAAATKQAEIEARGPQVPPEAPAGAQGTLFSEEEMGKIVPTPAEPAPAQEPKAPEGQQDLGLDYQREYADLAKERERLAQQEQTPEVKARADELAQQMALYNQSDIESIRAGKEIAAKSAAEDAKARKKFPGLSAAPDLMAQTDEVKARTQGEMFPGEDLGTKPEAAIAEPTLRTPKEKAPLQYKLPLRQVPEGREPKRELTIPKRPGELSMEDVVGAGVSLRPGMGPWFEQNVVGKTPDELRAFVAKQPDLAKGKAPRAKILRELLAPTPAKFEEAPSVQQTPAPTPAVEQRNEPRAGEPSMGVPSEPQPAPARAPAAAKPVTPDGRGLVSAGQPAVQGDEAQGTQPAAVKLHPRMVERIDAVEAQDEEREQAEYAAQRSAMVAAFKNKHDRNVKAAWAAVQRARQALKTSPPQSSIAANDIESFIYALEDAAQRYDRFINDEFVTQKALEQLEPTVAEIPQLVADLSAELGLTKAQPKPAAVDAETADEEAARKAEAEDFKRRLEALEKATPAAPAAVKQEAPKAEKPAAKPKAAPAEDEEAIAPIQERPNPFDAIAKYKKAKADAEAAVKNKPKAEISHAEKSTLAEATLQEHVAQGDVRGALQAILAAPKELYNELDRAVARRILLSNKLPTVQVVEEGSLGESDDGKVVAGQYDAVNDTVSLADGYVGAHTLLHELVHGFTHRAIESHRAGNTNNAGVRALQELYDHVAKVDPKALESYGMANVSEFAAEAMSNKEFQAILSRIPYRRTNAFTEFAKRVLQVLGLAPTEAHTALAAAMISVDTIMTGGRQMQIAETGTGVATAKNNPMAVAPGTESLVDSMGPLDVEQKSGLTKLIAGFKTQSEVNYATKFRTQTADAAATIEHRLREKFDGAVRDSLGKFNPMGLYRQAQDHAKLLLEYFQQGSLVKDTATGLWRVDTTKGVRPPAEVYALIDKWADKNGYTRERATQIASRVLEGVRLDAMRTSNKNDGTEFLLHLKDAEIDQLVREYKADSDLQAMSKLMDEARLAMVDNMVAVGRLSPDQGKAWKDAAGYVPFDRIEDFAERFSKIKKISNKGLAQIGKLPELVGSLERPVGNVFDNYLNTLGWMVGQTMKTDATVQTLRSLEDLGQAKFLGRSNLGKANAVGMYVGGEMMYWDLPSKYDVLAFKDLNPPKAHWLRALGEFSNVLRKSVTVLPPFALKQVTDDVQRAIMTSGVKSPSALLRMSLTNFPKLALAELRGIQHPMVREFGALGLTGEYDFQAGKPATSLLKDLGYKERGKFETLLHRLDGITRASDLSVRKAIYDQTLKETNDQLLAQTRAREFINFRRRGASDFVGAMVTVIPFFNAYIQGMDVLYRAASGKDSSSSVDRAQARRLFWSRAGTVMMLSSLYAVGKDDDDEDYKEMDLRTRDSNWVLPGGYKIPVPGELGALFKVIPERVVEYMKRQGSPEEQDAWEATRTALSYIYEQYLGRVTPVPQAVKPLLEAWSNKSFLTGRPLEGFHHQQMEPSMRRTEQTSELAVAIANFSRDTVGVEVSPIMVDNALRGYFGSTAGLLTATTDSLLNPTRVDRPLHKWALASNYMYDPVGTRRMTEFYEEREKVGKAGATLRELMNTDIDRAATYAEEHADELMLEKSINATLQYLEETRAYRKYLNSAEGAKELSAEDREAQLKEVKQMEVQYTSWLREAKAAIRQ
jgi:hypothetical protein